MKMSIPHSNGFMSSLKNSDAFSRLNLYVFESCGYTECKFDKYFDAR